MGVDAPAEPTGEREVSPDWAIARNSYSRAHAAERLATLHALTDALSRAVGVEEVARAVMEHGLATLEASATLVAVCARDGGCVDLLASRGLPNDGTRRLALDVPSPIGAAVREGAPLYVERRDEIDARFAPLFGGGVRVGAIAAIPVRVDDRVLGAVCVCFEHERGFDEEERRHLLTVAAQCAHALDRARLRDAERRASERFRLVADAGAELGATLDHDRIVADLVELLVPALADVALVDVLGPDPHTIVRARDERACAILDELAARAPDGELACADRCRVEAPLDDAQWASIAGAPAREAAMRRLAPTAAIVAPLAGRGEIAGRITLLSCGARGYDDEDLALCEAIARRAAVALENARLHRDAESAIQMRDDFLSMAGHELKTPLTSLRLHLAGLRRDATLPAKARSRADLADRQVGRLARLVDGLLDVSRIVAGRLSLELTPVDLAEIVADAVAHLEDERSRSVSAISLRLEPIVGLWDALRVDQVVTNLVSNAIKYGAGAPIDVSLARVGDVARLVVHDRGIGISEESRARLFQRFERAVSPRDYRGLGLGLWITRQIVEAAGGRVDVESREGQGSTFTAELPIVAQRA